MKDYLKGVFYAFVTGSIVFVIGIILSFLIIGIPIAILGGLMILISPLTGFYLKTIKCPICQQTIYYTSFRYFDPKSYSWNIRRWRLMPLFVTCKHCKSTMQVSGEIVPNK